MRVAPDLSTNVRVIEKSWFSTFAKMPRSQTDWLPGSYNETLAFRVERKRELTARVGRSKTDWLLVCNETFRVERKRELTARVGSARDVTAPLRRM